MAMNVGQIIKAVTAKYPDLKWGSCSGGVRANLIRMAENPNSPICIMQGTKPPKFYVKIDDQSIATPKSQSHGPLSHTIRMNSVFYEPCLEILRECSPEAMSANSLMKEVIVRHPDLKWSRTQGPIRAMLLSASKKEGTGIRQLPNVLPPQFYYEKKSRNTSSAPQGVEASAEEIMGLAYLQTIDALKEKLRDIIKGLSPTEFEHLANRVIAKVLFGEAEDTPPSGDGGVDGFVHRCKDPSSNSLTSDLGLNVVVIQAKHYKRCNVPAPDIQRFIGALHQRPGVFVTSADFSQGARAEAKQAIAKLHLVTGEELINYMIMYKIGVREGKVFTIPEVDEDFFAEEV